MKTDDFIVAMTIIGVAAAVNLGFIVYRLLRNPFQYPYFVWWFDVSYKRNVDIRDCIDSFLCNEQNWRALKQHEQSIKQWKHDTENYLQTCILKKRRVRQYQEVLDDNSAFRFGTSRNRTRYKQQNYVKTAYKIPTAESIMACTAGGNRLRSNAERVSQQKPAKADDEGAAERNHEARSLHLPNVRKVYAR